MIEVLYRKVLRADVFFSEYEEWLSRLELIRLRRDMQKKTGDLNAVLEMNKIEDEAQKVVSAIEKEITALMGVETTGEARTSLFEIKSILNVFSVKTGETFVEDNNLENMHIEELSVFISELISEEPND